MGLDRVDRVALDGVSTSWSRRLALEDVDLAERTVGRWRLSSWTSLAESARWSNWPSRGLGREDDVAVGDQAGISRVALSVWGSEKTVGTQVSKSSSEMPSTS